MSWILLAEIAYGLLVIFVILRVLYDTRSSTKALAYILFIVFVPFVGMIFYFYVGINYRKRKLYSKKIVDDEPLRKSIKERMNTYSESIGTSGLVAGSYQNLSKFILHSGSSPLTANNQVKLLINGE
ncbi:MAG: PLDc N-terminal domain-containing protein [Gelidibacter sp.]